MADTSLNENRLGLLIWQTSNIWQSKLRKILKNHNISLNEHFYFHPRCSLNEFLGLIEQSDIILDSINWSGCNTSLDALSLNKPIVTYPSVFMRGRHTYGFLKKLNIEETVAHSKEEFIEIALTDSLVLNLEFK